MSTEEDTKCLIEAVQQFRQLVQTDSTLLERSVAVMKTVLSTELTEREMEYALPALTSTLHEFHAAIVAEKPLDELEKLLEIKNIVVAAKHNSGNEKKKAIPNKELYKVDEVCFICRYFENFLSDHCSECSCASRD